MDEWKDDNTFHWRCSEISVNMHRIALCWRLQLASISFDIPGTVLYAVTLETNNPKWLCRAELLPRLLSGAQTACSGLFFALQNQMRRVASFGLFPEQVTNHSPPPPLWFVSSVLSQCVKHWLIVFLGHFDTDLNPQLWCQTRPESLNLVLKPIVSSVFYHSLHFWSDYMNKIVLHSKTIQRIVTERYLSLTLICGWTLNLWIWMSVCVKVSVGQQRAHSFFLSDAGHILHLKYPSMSQVFFGNARVFHAEHCEWLDSPNDWSETYLEVQRLFTC